MEAIAPLPAAALPTPPAPYACPRHGSRHDIYVLCGPAADDVQLGVAVRDALGAARRADGTTPTVCLPHECCGVVEAEAASPGAAVAGPLALAAVAAALAASAAGASDLTVVLCTREMLLSLHPVGHGTGRLAKAAMATTSPPPLLMPLVAALERFAHGSAGLLPLLVPPPVASGDVRGHPIPITSRSHITHHTSHITRPGTAGGGDSSGVGHTGDAPPLRPGTAPPVSAPRWLMPGDAADDNTSRLRGAFKFLRTADYGLPLSSFSDSCHPGPTTAETSALADTPPRPPRLYSCRATLAALGLVEGVRLPSGEVTTAASAASPYLHGVLNDVHRMGSLRSESTARAARASTAFARRSTSLVISDLLPRVPIAPPSLTLEEAAAMVTAADTAPRITADTDDSTCDLIPAVAAAAEAAEAAAGVDPASVSSLPPVGPRPSPKARGSKYDLKLTPGGETTVAASLLAAPTGASIYLAPGIYRESLILHPGTEVHLYGEGDAYIQPPRGCPAVVCTARVATLDGLVIIADSAPALVIESGGAMIQGCTASSRGQSPGSAVVAIAGAGSHPLLLSCRVHGGEDVGIRVADAAAPRIEGCTVEQCTGALVEVTTGAAPRIVRCVLRSGETTGLAVMQDGMGVYEDNDLSGCHLEAIMVQDGADPVITRNRIHDTVGGGVLITVAGKGRIEDNDVSGCGGPCVEIQEGGEPIVARNRLTGSSGPGVLVTRGGAGRVEKNEIWGCRGYGIELAGDAGEAVVLSNDVHENDRGGIHVASGSSARVGVNTVRELQGLAPAVVRPRPGSARRDRGVGESGKLKAAAPVGVTLGVASEGTGRAVQRALRPKSAVALSFRVTMPSADARRHGFYAM